MAIDPISLAASSGRLDAAWVGDTPSTGGVSEAFGLGRDDFFRLFLAQLKNQDPTQPFNDKDFLAQLAQFSLIDTLEQVKRALGGTQLAQASGLLGRHVEGLGDDGGPINGRVERILQDSSGITLVVGDRALRPENVTRVTTSEP